VTIRVRARRSPSYAEYSPRRRTLLKRRVKNLGDAFPEPSQSLARLPSVRARDPSVIRDGSASRSSAAQPRCYESEVALLKILVFFLAALMPVAAAAQTAPDASPAPAASPGATAPAQPAATESDAQKAADLQAAAANPIASMISVPFQYNANFSYGPYKGIQQVLNVQPVIPTNLGAVTRGSAAS